MSKNIFSPDEILRLAVKIEENGKKFYESMVKKIEDDKVKSLLEFLAGEEMRHKKTFEDILNSLDEKIIVESYGGEYEAYMSALARECVFTQTIVEKKTEDGFSNTLDLLDFALRIEKDSIILYTQMRGNVLKDIPPIEKIIQEEMKHFILISDLKKNIL